MKNYQNKPVESDSPKNEFQGAPVSDYMVREKDLITFKPETDIMEVVDTLLQHEITGAPVLNDKKELVGLIDDKDCLNVLFASTYHNEPVSKRTASHFMSNVMKTLNVHADIYDVADIFLKSPYKRLLIVDDEGKLIGQISRQDILRAIHDLNTNPR
ncbi:MAG: CBS domain-containing protein [Phaeodactylibacter sp.]|nr:CBS domain-containing protein [Phaeodactylibacter sp.]MCB9263814.1 CBS domain-containing protein [Lewinellaceae bacterium]MCB9288265.1 CBS domain-containing protein [Lewinellaceae bacterium]